MKKIINGICIGLGFLCIGLGVIGIVLPVLPATPFLILAAVLFAKGSEKFHQWFIKTALYEKYVVPAMGKKAMDKNSKIKTMIILFIIFIFDNLPNATIIPSGIDKANVKVNISSVDFNPTIT